MFKDKLTEILNFFDPVELRNFEDSSYMHDELSFGNKVMINSAIGSLLSDNCFEIAIIGVKQYLKNEDSQLVNTPQIIREELYRLTQVSSGLRVADLGDLKNGKSINETLFSLQEACALLFHLNINVVIIGGSQLLTLGNFRAFKEFENNINMVNIDSKIDLSPSSDLITENNYLNAIVEQEAAHLYNLFCVGYQSYFVSSNQIKILNKHCFEHYRLGVVRSKFENIESVMRDADLVSFDISALKMNEAPGQNDASPNGFYGDEACRLSRYAGLSDRVQSFGIYNIDARFDISRQTTKLAAHVIWYYIYGYANRKRDYPKASLNNYIKYEVQIDEIDFPIVFYKSNKSDRWWIEVQIDPGNAEIRDRFVVACTEDDYLCACNNDIPEKWWLNFKKLK